MAQTTGSNKFEKWEETDLVSKTITDSNNNLQKIDNKLDSLQQTVRFKKVGADDPTESPSWLEVLKKNYSSLQNGQGYMLHLAPYGAQVWAIGFKKSANYGAFLAFSYTNHVTYVQVKNAEWTTKVIG